MLLQMKVGDLRSLSLVELDDKVLPVQDFAAQQQELHKWVVGLPGHCRQSLLPARVVGPLVVLSSSCCMRGLVLSSVWRTLVGWCQQGPI